MRIMILTLFLLTGVACKRPLSRTVLQDKLKNAMQDYLQHQRSEDSLKVKFEVLDVTWSEEAQLYNCEFKVRLIMPAKDTIGIMTGTISKDFATIHRTF